MAAKFGLVILMVAFASQASANVYQPFVSACPTGPLMAPQPPAAARASAPPSTLPTLPPIVAPPVTIPLPLPALIPVGNLCTCKSVLVKPSLTPVPKPYGLLLPPTCMPAGPYHIPSFPAPLAVSKAFY